MILFFDNRAHYYLIIVLIKKKVRKAKLKIQ